uniref:Ubs_32 putative toxin n=1 Tax=Unedogemmula bisaya TaxID=746885 RepID=A0A098LXX8_UNEBI
MARLIFLCELMIFFLVVVCFTNSQDSSAPDDPPRPECGPICRMYCFTGFVKDKNGCEICECNPNDNDDLVAPTMLLYIITSKSIWEAPLLLPMRLKRKTTPHH